MHRRLAFALGSAASPVALAFLLAISIGMATPAACAEPAGELAQRLAGVRFDQFAQAPGYSEGPTWLRGQLFFCSGALLRADAPGKAVKYLDINPAGTVARGDGHLLICDNKYKAILDLSPEGRVGVVAERFEGRPLRSLNDLTVDARGNVYWTDPEGSSATNLTGNVFRLRPEGRVDRVATGLAFPNGLDVDPASRHLYVIESQTKRILRYRLPADDELLGPPEVFYDLGGSGGDGCAFDAAGNLWVADFHRPETGQGRITVLSPRGEALAWLAVPAKLVSNITFGGAAGDEIFCTTGDPPGVFRAAVGVQGFAGHPGRPLPIVRELDVVVRRPHPDAPTLARIVQAAEEANWEGASFATATRQKIESLLADLTDPALRSDMKKQLPELEQAAAWHAGDRQLLAEVKRLHGRATLEIRAPKWLRAIVGAEGLAVFGRIIELELNERTDGHKAAEPKSPADRVTDDWLKLVAGQSQLRRLELSGTAVTSAGLAHLKDLTQLEVLNVCLTAVDDEGLAWLPALTNMRRMVVCSSKVTGSGFRHLGGMTHLESINLHSSPASDAGLEAIGKLTSLKRLEIVHTNVSDAGLGHLAALTNLQQLHIHGHDTTEAALPFLGQLRNLYELDIYGPPASNATLAQVGQLPHLRFLRLINGTFDDEAVKNLAGRTTLEEVVLSSNKLTDAAIEPLAGLKTLRRVQLSGTRITPAGRERLARLLPKATIVP